jgi:hypothetical protein
MMALIDTDTKELLAKFANETLARLAGKAISQETRRPLTLTASDRTSKPIARFVDGEEIRHTATVHYL